MAVETTVIVNFGNIDSTTTKVVFELDDEKNEGNTSFSPGDTIYFKAQISNNVVINYVVTTAGSVSSNGVITYEQVDEFTFTSREEIESNELSYIPVGGVTEKSWGRPGIVSVIQSPSGVVSCKGDIAATPFIVTLTYNYKILSYKLVAPQVDLSDGSSYPIVVVMYLTNSEDLNECSSL